MSSHTFCHLFYFRLLGEKLVLDLGTIRNAPPNTLVDSTTNLNVKTMKG